MFPRRERLPRSNFPEALKSGRRVSSAYFSVVVSNKGRGYAAIVPKKIARLSVSRHRLKRRVLAALRTIPVLPPSVIVFPKSSAKDLSYEGVCAELTNLLSKTKQ